MVMDTEDNAWMQMSLVSVIAKSFRSQLRVGKYWRRNAWETACNALIACGAGMREAGPVDAKCYALIADIALEYLRCKQNRSPKRVDELYRIIRDDFKAFRASVQMLESFMTRQECSYLSEARTSCITNMLELDLLKEELVSPDTG